MFLMFQGNVQYKKRIMNINVDCLQQDSIYVQKLHNVKNVFKIYNLMESSQEFNEADKHRHFVN